MSLRDTSAEISKCPAVASTGQACQLPAHHNSPHEYEDEHGKMTWEPRYVGDLRRAVDGDAFEAFLGGYEAVHDGEIDRESVAASFEEWLHR